MQPRRIDPYSKKLKSWGHLNPERADGFTGMLIDLDLAIEDVKRTVGRSMYSAESSIPTGMIWNRSSTCYCGCVLVARGKENSNAAQETGPGGIFWGGCMGSIAADVADAKLWNMHTDGFKGILEEFVPTI